MHFRPYLYGREFILVSDHEPLKWIDSVKPPLQPLIRWRTRLREYSYEFVHKPGRLNTNADSLSRNPEEAPAVMLPNSSAGRAKLLGRSATSSLVEKLPVQKGRKVGSKNAPLPPPPADMSKLGGTIAERVLAHKALIQPPKVIEKPKGTLTKRSIGRPPKTKPPITAPTTSSSSDSENTIRPEPTRRKAGLPSLVPSKLPFIQEDDEESSHNEPTKPKPQHPNVIDLAQMTSDATEIGQSDLSNDDLYRLVPRTSKETPCFPKRNQRISDEFWWDEGETRAHMGTPHFRSTPIEEEESTEAETENEPTHVLPRIEEENNEDIMIGNTSNRGMSNTVPPELFYPDIMSTPTSNLK